MQPTLIVNDITKRFRLSKKQQKIEKTKDPIKVAVNHLSFQAYPGEIYGLLGPNGAGKTTALRCASTLMKPDSGDITLNGHSVLTDEELVRRTIGFLTSELKLEDFFTPNYLFDYFSALHGIDVDTMKRTKKELFSRFGIDKFAEVKVGELSTGMKQKIQIAIALVHNPDVIIFDEPTNGLDILTAKVVTDYLIELKNLGKTIVISTHIFSLVEKICDRVGIIIDGALKAERLLDDETRKEADLESLFFQLVSESEAAKLA
ncbi:MAG: ATP-binding cassette domain-containing protein [Bacillus subtilis]|nr:ATP-binding cassette domain-containing protein [Bacillus subtilis]